MRPTRTTALVFAAVTLAATAAGPSPAEAFFFPIPLFVGRPHAVTVNPSRGPTERMGRVYTVKPDKASTGARSRDEDNKPRKASTGTRSKDDDGKSSSGSGKGAKSATKAEANANSGHGGRQTQRRWSVEHEPATSKSSGHASTSVQRAGSSAGANSDTQGGSLTGTNSNTGDFDENLGEARIDD